MKPICRFNGLIVMASVLMLAGCASGWPESTTPVLDARFGQALNEAKRQQSLPTPAPLSAEAVATGVGQPTATETGPGLQAQQQGKSVSPAFNTAR